MSFYEDQEEDWFANDCKGSPSNYDGAGNFVPEEMGPTYDPKTTFVDAKKPRTEAHKAKKRRNRARRRAKKEALAKQAGGQP